MIPVLCVQLWELRMASSDSRCDGHDRLRPVPARSLKSCAIAQRILRARLSLAALDAEDAASGIGIK